MAEKIPQHILDGKIDVVKTSEIFALSTLNPEAVKALNTFVNKKLEEYWNDGYKVGKSDGEQKTLRFMKQGLFKVEKEFYTKK